MKSIIKKIISPFIKLKYGVRNSNGKLYIGKSCKLEKRKNIKFYSNVQISNYCVIVPLMDGVITFKEGSYIGMFSRITAINEVVIGKNVITGPNVFISDYNHNYENINISIKDQGYKINLGDKVIIDDDSWIGTNVCIIGNVNIGKHCVIGANSVVTKDIPPYSIAVGNPAKVIKKYNFQTNQWDKVGE